MLLLFPLFTDDLWLPYGARCLQSEGVPAVLRRRPIVMQVLLLAKNVTQ